MPKSRIRPRAKIKKKKVRKTISDRERRINDIEAMWADLKVHEDAAKTVESMTDEEKAAELAKLEENENE